MPQAFYELYYKGETGPDILAFWAQYLDFDLEFSIITPTYNHLWYVVYVLDLHSPAGGPAAAAAADSASRRTGVRRMGSAALILVPAGWFAVLVLTMGDEFPVTHALVDDWFNHATSFSILLFGWFAAKSPGFWRTVDKALPAAGAAAIATGVGACPDAGRPGVRRRLRHAGSAVRLDGDPQPAGVGAAC